MATRWTTLITAVCVLFFSWCLYHDQSFPPATVDDVSSLLFRYVLRAPWTACSFVVEVPWQAIRWARSIAEDAASDLERWSGSIAARATNERGVLYWDEDIDRFTYNMIYLARGLIAYPVEALRSLHSVLGYVMADAATMRHDEMVAYCHSRGGCRDALVHIQHHMLSRLHRPPIYPSYVNDADETPPSDDETNPTALICSGAAVYSDVSFLTSFIQSAEWGDSSIEDIILLEGDALVGEAYAGRADGVIDIDTVMKQVHAGEFWQWAHDSGFSFFGSPKAADYEIMAGIQSVYNAYVLATHRAPETDVLFYRLARHLSKSGVDTSKAHLQPIFVCKLEHWLDLEPMADSAEEAVVGEKGVHAGSPISTQQLMLAWLVHEGHVKAHRADAPVFFRYSEEREPAMW